MFNKGQQRQMRHICPMGLLYIFLSLKEIEVWEVLCAQRETLMKKNQEMKVKDYLIPSSLRFPEEMRPTKGDVVFASKQATDFNFSSLASSFFSFLFSDGHLTHLPFISSRTAHVAVNGTVEHSHAHILMHWAAIIISHSKVQRERRKGPLASPLWFLH